MVQCGARARSLVLLEFLASWLLEFFLMSRRKVSGNSRAPSEFPKSEARIAALEAPPDDSHGAGEANS